MNEFVQVQGWNAAKIHDPSGYDFIGSASVVDLGSVCEKLLKQQWIRNIVSQSSYTAVLPGGESQTWANTNKFLDPESGFFNPGVRGVKNGSLGSDYNLIVLYSVGAEEFLVVSIGSKSDTFRYSDISNVLKDLGGNY
ncbi:hypothetical protein RQN30_06955 [Arcanobacterium hippocoleae]